MSYTYWNTFIDTWRSLPHKEYINAFPLAPYHIINGWENPNLLPLYGTDGGLDLSLQYLPEPWWGNDGSSPLESVIINYNPAGLNKAYFGASSAQHYMHSSHLYGFPNYSDFIKNEVSICSTRFPRKYKFHFSDRANRVFGSLTRNRVHLVGSALKNHLSVELAPWYTPTSNLIRPYILRNIKSVYDNCILFAANESRRIHNTVLKNKVIIRASRDFILSLLPYFGSYTTSADRTTISGNGKWFSFSLDDIPGIEFVCIWGPKSRNDFPSHTDLDEILNAIKIS
jgi:hypothetical protein